MIVRAWRGWTTSSNQHAYVSHFQRNVIPQLRGVDGFVGVTLLKEVQSEQVEFLVLSRWVSMDAIRSFAGKDITRAVVEPEAVAVLVDFERTVHHYEIVEEVAA